MLKHETVTSFLDGVSFSSNPDLDLQIAEQVASNTYPDLDDLIRICRGEIGGKKLLHAFEIHCIDFKINHLSKAK